MHPVDLVLVIYKKMTINLVFGECMRVNHMLSIFKVCINIFLEVVCPTISAQRHNNKLY